jgi:hypothetical protein
MRTREARLIAPLLPAPDLSPGVRVMEPPSDAPAVAFPAVMTMFPPEPELAPPAPENRLMSPPLPVAPAVPPVTVNVPLAPEPFPLPRVKLTGPPELLPPVAFPVMKRYRSAARSDSTRQTVSGGDCESAATEAIAAGELKVPTKRGQSAASCIAKTAGKDERARSVGRACRSGREVDVPAMIRTGTVRGSQRDVSAGGGEVKFAPAPVMVPEKFPSTL